MNVNELSELLGVHVNTIYNHIKSGRIEAEKKAGSWSISQDEFLRLKREQSRTPRIAIDSLTISIDEIRMAKKHLEKRIQEWNGVETLEQIEKFKGYEATIKSLQDLRSTYYYLLEHGAWDSLDDEVSSDLRGDLD